jgi:hypothetical protein
MAPTLRDGYLRWLRTALPALVIPFASMALVQWAASATWWSSGPVPSGAARYLFLAVGAASVVVGRDVRRREVAAGSLDLGALRSLSWQLVFYALAPVTIGVVLAFMTRQVLDFYAMLAVTLVGLVLLFPRYDQWASWTASPPEVP